MEGSGLDTGIEQHERIAGHIIATSPMPYHRLRGVEAPYELKQYGVAFAAPQPVGNGVPEGGGGRRARTGEMGRKGAGRQQRALFFQACQHGIHPVHIIRPLIEEGTERFLVACGVEQGFVQDGSAGEQPRGVDVPHGVDDRIGGAKNIELSLIGRIHGKFLTGRKCAGSGEGGQPDFGP